MLAILLVPKHGELRPFFERNIFSTSVVSF